MESVLYMGTTYLCNETRISDPAITCIGAHIDDCIDYLSKVRHIHVTSEEDLTNMPDDINVCAMITAVHFSSEEAKSMWLGKPAHSPYFLIPYGKIDRRIAGIGKKDAKSIMVPNVVESIIERSIIQFQTELTMAKHTLKSLLYYINGLDRGRLKVDKDSCNLTGSIKLIERMTSMDGYELENDMYYRHPILFCGEAEYRHEIAMQLDHERLDTEYHMRVQD